MAIQEDNQEDSLNLDMEILSKKLAKGGGLTFASQIISKASRFVLNLVLSRILGVAGYGVYTLGYSIFSIIRRIMLLGIDNAIVRYFPAFNTDKNSEEVPELINSALVIVFASGLFFGIVLYLKARYFSLLLSGDKSLIVPLKIISISLPVFALMFILAYILRGIQQVNYDISIRNVIFPLLYLGFTVLFLVLGYSHLGAFYSLSISGFITMLIGFYFLKIKGQHFVNLKVYPSISKFKLLLKFGIPVVLSNALYIFMSYADRFMLGILSVASEVGIYSAAFQLTALISIFASVMRPMFEPMVSGLWSNKNVKSLKKVYSLATRWIITFGLIITLLFVLFSNNFMNLFGKEFTQGSMVLIILSIASFLNISTGLTGRILVMTDLAKLTFINNSIMVGLNIILNYYLIPKFGAMGAAIATSFSQVSISFLEVVEIFYFRKIHPFNKLLIKPIFSAIITCFIVLALNNISPNILFIVNLIITLLIFFLILYFLGLEKEDKKIIFVFMRKLKLGGKK